MVESAARREAEVARAAVGFALTGLPRRVRPVMGDEATPGSLPAYTPGDLLRAIRPLHLLRGAVAAEERPDGQIYRVVDLKGRGFDLVSGEGPLEIRAMNSEVPGKFRVLPQP